MSLKGCSCWAGHIGHIPEGHRVAVALELQLFAHAHHHSEAHIGAINETEGKDDCHDRQDYQIDLAYRLGQLHRVDIGGPSCRAINACQGDVS